LPKDTQRDRKIHIRNHFCPIVGMFVHARATAGTWRAAEPLLRAGQKSRSYSR
jgi:hypothetical protein